LINGKFYHLHYKIKTFFCQEKNFKDQRFYFTRTDT
jgi:hypothetical protein